MKVFSGGKQATTVAFQKRFNDLMSQNQFNLTGFVTINE
jgi:hypothetical protein